MCIPSANPTCWPPNLSGSIPCVPFETYIDQFGNRCTRLVAPEGTLTLSNSFVIRDSGVQETPALGREPGAGQRTAP